MGHIALEESLRCSNAYPENHRRRSSARSSELVDSILEAKAANPDADTSHLEWDIDRLVYDLYGLTEEEDTAIERSLRLIHQTDEEEDEAIARAIEESLTDERVSREEVMAILRNPDGG